MSDPVGYIAMTVVGPDTVEALTWLRRHQVWERRLDELRHEPLDGARDRRRPPNAA